MQLTQVDLNLLVVLDALLETQSIKDAAQRLSLSPSATSHALARLRLQLDDELLTRAGRQMVPTAKALRLQGSVRAVLDDAAALFRPDDVQRPEALARAFIIGSNDFFELVLLPGLSAWAHARAPGVRLFSQALRDSGVAGLRGGQYDVCVGVYAKNRIPNDIRLQPLLFSPFICLLRAGHPALARPWDVEQYAAYDHVLVSPRGQARGVVDDRLAELGIERRVTRTVSSFSSAPALVAASDCIVTISAFIADAYAERYGLVRRPPPLRLSGFTVSAAWHARQANDPELGWLVGGIKETVSRVNAHRGEGDGQPPPPRVG